MPTEFPGGKASVSVAAEAVLGLWRQKTFLRASTDEPSDLRPTVTLRCTEVLLSVAGRERKLFSEAQSETVQAAVAVCAGLTHEEALDASELNYPPFTLALYTLVAARIAESDTDSSATARAKVTPAVREMLKLVKHKDLGNVHPFVQEHVLRALIAAAPIVPDTVGAKVGQLTGAIMSSAGQQAEALLAKHHLGHISPGESVALAFCAAALATSRTPTHDRVALTSLLAAIRAQDSGGSWPLGRVVQSEPSRLEISTYEVAWIVAKTLSQLLPRLDAERDEPVAALAQSIERATAFARRSLIEVADLRGWASDHPYQAPRIESWTSAIALQFMLAADDLHRDLENRAVLRTFNGADPDGDRWPSWLRWKNLKAGGDPETDSPVYGYLEEHVVVPILEHPRGLPSGDAETASVLLFGPPGTSKTTIVQAVADALSWPVVFLSPGTFIEQGLEAIEASAQSVFDRLQRLRRVVVIFDECDELFRDRTPSGMSEQTRSISAFVTASMLPKLQDLHDRGEVLFFVCTNHVGTMDAAVKRPGRIDHRVAVGPPDQAARKLILESMQPKSPPPRYAAAVDALARETQNFGRSELKRAHAKLLGTAPWNTNPAASDAAKKVAKSMSSALAITPEAAEQYTKDRNQFSDPYLEGS